jgi:hypothetical protein
VIFLNVDEFDVYSVESCQQR